MEQQPGMKRLSPSTILTRLCRGGVFLVLLFLFFDLIPCTRAQRNYDSKKPLINAEGEWVWQNPLPQGNTLQDFFFIDADNGFAVGASGTILRTTDGGNSWDI